MEFNFNPDDRTNLELADDPETRERFQEPQAANRALRAKEWENRGAAKAPPTPEPVPTK